MWPSFFAQRRGTAVPRISGSESDAVMTVTPILTGERKYSSRKIAVAGSGMTGLETAELLVDLRNTVTIIEMADKRYCSWTAFLIVTFMLIRMKWR